MTAKAPIPAAAPTLRMGDLASEAGVPRSTLRFYERRGLLPRPKRTRAGYRLYDPEVVVRVRFIQRAQALGFTLREVETFLRVSTGRIPRGVDVTALATQKLAEIDARVRDLRSMKRAIERLVAEGRRDDAPCPILLSLGGREGQSPLCDPD